MVGIENRMRCWEHVAMKNNRPIISSETPLERLMNEKEAAPFLGVSVRTLQCWRVRGGGPRFIRISRRAVRYCPSDLAEWIAARRVSNTGEADEL